MGLCITSILIMGENLYKIYIEFTLFILKIGEIKYDCMGNSCTTKQL